MQAGVLQQETIVCWNSDKFAQAAAFPLEHKHLCMALPLPNLCYNL
jgi:hypothetical protein